MKLPAVKRRGDFDPGPTIALKSIDGRLIERPPRRDITMSLKRATEDATSATAGGRRLRDLRNVGKAMLADFALLGIETVEQLARCEPESLYRELQQRTGTRHDPCVWDVFAAAIHQARTGEPRDWWEFTPERKRRQVAKAGAR
jgi:hypothetical protein